MRKIKYLPQFMQTECGLCCVAMIADYYGHSVSLQELREYQQPGRDGVSAQDMVDMFQWLRFDCKVYRCKREHLRAIPLPAVAFWDGSHYVVIEKIKEDRIYLVDPAGGRIICTGEEFDRLFSGVIFVPKPMDTFVPRKRGPSELRQYAFLLLKNKYLILAAVVLSLISYLFSMAIPIMVQGLIDDGTGSGNPLILVGLLVLLGYAVSFMASSLISVFVKTDVYKGFYKIAVGRLTDAAYGYFKNRNIGGIQYNLSCIDTVNDEYSAVVVGALISFGAVLILSGYVAVAAPLVFLVLLALLVLAFVALRVENHRIHRLEQLEITGRAELQKKQYEFLSSMESLKISGAETLFYQSWEKSFLGTARKTRSKNNAQAVYSSLISVFNFVIPLTVLLVSFSLASAGRISMGKAISLYSLVTVIASFAMSSFSSVNTLMLMRNYTDRIKDIVGQEPEKNGTETLTSLQEIRVEHLSFRYDKHSPTVLRDVSMVFRRGRKIAIVGASGCGKSSIAKLLIKLYPPAEGRILFDGIPAEAVENRQLRRTVGYVAQEGYLFNRSVRDNITMLAASWTMEEVDAVCKAVQIYDDIMKMPMKYETLLTDVGSNVSGGQRQRLILARALLAKPDFLVLDEATSALDSVTEQKIYDALNEMGYTQIIIAHRLSTVMDSDDIYVLKDGEIVEEGTHEQLISRNGEYAALYRGKQAV